MFVVDRVFIVANEGIEDTEEDTIEDDDDKQGGKESPKTDDTVDDNGRTTPTPNTPGPDKPFILRTHDDVHPNPDRRPMR